MGTGCPDLKRKFGKQYRVEWAPEHQPRSKDPWLYQIPCRAGVIVPWGEGLLAICLSGHSRLVRWLEEAGCQVKQQGDHETNLVFPLSLFRQVAKLVHPRIRRKLSATQKRTLVERLKRYREGNRSD